MKRSIARQVLIAKLAALALSAICFLQAPVRAQEMTGYTVMFPSVGLAPGQILRLTLFNPNGTPVRAQAYAHSAGAHILLGDGSVTIPSISETPDPKSAEYPPQVSPKGLKKLQDIMTTDFFNSFNLLPVTPPPGATPSPQATPTPKEILVRGGVLQGAVLKRVAPSYLPLAKAARVSGRVDVQVIISEEGLVIEAEVVSSPPLLWEAALNAAEQWVFKPTELSGVPVKVKGVLGFNFTLQ
jgi:TonB family protein